MSVEIVCQEDNLLIERLPRKERSRLLDNCERVELVSEEVLCESDQDLEYVYFPETCAIVLVTLLANHEPLGITLIGNEGMLGLVQVLGDDSPPLIGAWVQNSGTTLRMKAHQFRKQLRSSPGLVLSLNHHLNSLIGQMSQSLGCAHFHQIEPRLARWLLMTQDRVHSNQFHLTHNQLANILGVRRSGVTIAAGILQNKQLISYNRGDITVLDRKGLEAAACECYCIIKASLNRQ